MKTNSRDTEQEKRSIKEEIYDKIKDKFQQYTSSTLWNWICTFTDFPVFLEYKKYNTSNVK